MSRIGISDGRFRASSLYTATRGIDACLRSSQYSWSPGDPGPNHRWNSDSVSVCSSRSAGTCLSASVIRSLTESSARIELGRSEDVLCCLMWIDNMVSAIRSSDVIAPGSLVL